MTSNVTFLQDPEDSTWSIESQITPLEDPQRQSKHTPILKAYALNEICEELELSSGPQDTASAHDETAHFQANEVPRGRSVQRRALPDHRLQALGSFGGYRTAISSIPEVEESVENTGIGDREVVCVTYDDIQNKNGSKSSDTGEADGSAFTAEELRPRTVIDERSETSDDYMEACNDDNSGTERVNPASPSRMSEDPSETDLVAHKHCTKTSAQDAVEEFWDDLREKKEWLFGKLTEEPIEEPIEEPVEKPIEEAVDGTDNVDLMLDLMLDLIPEGDEGDSGDALDIFFASTALLWLSGFYVLVKWKEWFGSL